MIKRVTRKDKPRLIAEGNHRRSKDIIQHLPLILDSKSCFEKIFCKFKIYSDLAFKDIG